MRDCDQFCIVTSCDLPFPVTETGCAELGFVTLANGSVKTREVRGKTQERVTACAQKSARAIWTCEQF